MTCRPRWTGESLIRGDYLAEMCDMARASPPGCFVEVGVYQGGSARQLLDVALKQKRTLYLYDTFDGIPYKDAVDMHDVGDFADANLEMVQASCPEAIIVPGRFPESIVKMPEIAFAHIDVDQYRSTKQAIETLKPLMAKGGIMLFDDYRQVSGATNAINESVVVELSPLNRAYWRRDGLES